MPLSIFNTNTKEEEERKVVSDKNLVIETNIFNNNKFLKPIDNFHSTQKNKFRISKDKEYFNRKTNNFIFEKSVNNKLINQKGIFTSKNKSRKDVPNFESYDYFNFNHKNEKPKNKISLEYDKNNNDSINRKLFKSTDKFIKKYLVINSKMITFQN